MVSKDDVEGQARDSRGYIETGSADGRDRVIVYLADENATLRADLTVADDALKLAREAHQVTIDAENRLRATIELRESQITELVSTNAIETKCLRAQLAEAVALLETAPIGGTDAEVSAWVERRAKLRGAP